MTDELRTFQAYLDRVSPESPLADLCREVIEGEMRPMTDSVHLGLEEGLALIASPPLWVWAAIQLDALRNRKETQEAERRITMILSLQNSGYSREHAEQLVDKTLNAIRKRNKEDPAIKLLLQIASVVKGLKLPSHAMELTQDDTTKDDSELS